MSKTFGIFKELYRGQGVYWQRGAFNVDGNGSYPTLAAVKVAIDHHVEDLEARESTAKQAKAASGKYIVAKRVGNGVVFGYPDGTTERFRTVREARQVVFEREDQYETEIVWL